MSQQSLASESAGQAASVEQAAARPAYHLDWLLIVLASLILFLCRSTRLPAMDPDESRCAVAVQQMLDSGNWLIANSKKPAAFFWLAAAAQKATEPLFGKVGSVQLAGRLVSAIAGCLAVLIAYSWAKRLGGRGRAGSRGRFGHNGRVPLCRPLVSHGHGFYCRDAGGGVVVRPGGYGT